MLSTYRIILLTPLNRNDNKQTQKNLGRQLRLVVAVPLGMNHLSHMVVDWSWCRT